MPEPEQGEFIEPPRHLRLAGQAQGYLEDELARETAGGWQVETDGQERLFKRRLTSDLPDLISYLKYGEDPFMQSIIDQLSGFISTEGPLSQIDPRYLREIDFDIDIQIIYILNYMDKRKLTPDIQIMLEGIAQNLKLRARRGKGGREAELLVTQVRSISGPTGFDQSGQIGQQQKKTPFFLRMLGMGRK